MHAQECAEFLAGFGMQQDLSQYSKPPFKRLARAKIYELNKSKLWKINFDAIVKESFESKLYFKNHASNKNATNNKNEFPVRQENCC